MAEQRITFSFGRNWIEYVKNFLTKERLDEALASFEKYLPKEEYKEKILIDIGCGSGIFSFNALRMGCKKVISFDVDPRSVEATRLTKEKFGNLLSEDAQWEIFEGSILDSGLISRLKGQGDIVYSWGVLHHTGNMWQAIENAASLVKPGGYFIIAIYNKAPSSEYWLKVKEIYNKLPAFFKLLTACAFYSYMIFRKFLSYFKSIILNQPKHFKLRDIFRKERGMSVFYDMVDWLGGYPYEYATVAEIKNFVEEMGFILVKAPTRIPEAKRTILNRFYFTGTGCNEFVFKSIIQPTKF